MKINLPYKILYHYKERSYNKTLKYSLTLFLLIAFFWRKINEPFRLASNLTNEGLYDNFNKKNKIK